MENIPNESRQGFNVQNLQNIPCVGPTPMNTNYNQQHHEHATGLKSSLHGVSWFYQLKIILLVLLQMCKLMDNDENLVFEITTEDPDAGKFDDTVCKYIYKGVPRTMCIQAKHKLTDHKITWGELTSKASKAPYALAKYFTSFLEQQPTTMFGDQSLILCTNADLHQEMEALFDLQPAKSALQPDMSDIFESMGAKCYRFNADKLEEVGKFNDIRDLLENCSDCNRLAKLLATNVYNEKKVTLQTPLFKTYRNAIVNNTAGTCRDHEAFLYNFKEEFISKDTTFRTAFEKEYKQLAKTDLDVWDDAKKKGIAFSEGFLPKPNAPTCDSKPDLPNDIVTDDTRTTFFQKFVLVCSTQNEEKLPDIIMDAWQTSNVTKLPMELKGLLENEIAYQSLSDIIFQWMKAAKTKPLREKDVPKLFQDIVRKLQYLNLRFESNKFIDIIKECNLCIRKKLLEGSKLFNFLQPSATSDDDEKMFTYASSYDVEFSSWVVYQTIQHCFTSQSNYEITFIDSEKFRQNRDLALGILRSSGGQKILVVVCKENDLIPDHEETNLRGILNKVIFVKHYSESTTSESIQDRFTIKDLTDDSIDINENRSIFGTVTLLADIIEDDDDVAILFKLTSKACDPAVKMNLIEQDYQKIKDWYLQRDTQRSGNNQSIQIIEDVTSKKAHNDQRQPLNVGSFREVDEMSWADFRIEAEKSFGKSKIDDKQIETIINSYSTSVVHHCPGIEYDSDVKVHILLEEAGFGKSTYLTWLGRYLQTKNDSWWIIRFNAIEYSTDFKRLLTRSGEDPSTIDENFAIRTLFEMTHLALFLRNAYGLTKEEMDEERVKAKQCAELLSVVEGSVEVNEHKCVKQEISPRQLIEMRLFVKKFNNSELILLFDGFDEIIPNYKQVVFDLLHKFEKFEGVDKIYLTSRPYKFKNEFEAVFDDVKFYRLKPFSDEDRLVSIDTFLKKEFDGYKYCPKDQIQERTHLLVSLECITRYYLWNLRETPLFTRMALDVLSTLIRENVDFTACRISIKIIDLCHDRFEKLNLIRSCIENKLKINVANTQITNDNTGKEMFSFLALYVMFNVEERAKLLIEGDPEETFLEFKNFVNRGTEKSGIVEAVQDDVPLFVHRTFAEYFAALWLYTKRNDPVVKRFLRSPAFWRDTRREMREYFDRMFIANRNMPHLTAIDRSANDVKIMLMEEPNCIYARDEAGRTPLHWVTLYYPFNVARFNVFFETVPLVQQTLLDEKDSLLEWSALDYAFMSNDSYTVQQLIEYGSEINVINLAQQILQGEVEEIVRTTVRYGEMILENSRYRCKKQDKALKTFLTDVSSKIAEHLIKEKKISLQLPCIQFKEKTLTVLQYCVEKKAGGFFVNLIEQAGGIEKIPSNAVDDLIKRAVTSEDIPAIHYLLDVCKRNVPSDIHFGEFFYIVRMTISNHYHTLFKIVFKQLCALMEIEYTVRFRGEFGINEEQELCMYHRPVVFSQEKKIIEAFSSDPVSLSGNQTNLFKLLYSSICSGNCFTVKTILPMISFKLNNYVMTRLLHYVEQDDLSGCVNRQYQKALIAIIEEKVMNPKDFEDSTGETLLQYALTCNLFEVARYLAEHKGFSTTQIGGKLKRNAFFYCIGTRNDVRFEKVRAELFEYMMEKDPFDCFTYRDENGKNLFSGAVDRYHFRIAKFVLEHQLNQYGVEEREPKLIKLLKDSGIINKREFRNFFDYLLEKTIKTEENDPWMKLYTCVHEHLKYIVEL